MKKIVIFLMAAGALLMASCTKNEVPAPQNDESIKLNINISGPGNDTKAAKKSWVAGDKLNIWFDTNHNQSTPDLIITYNGTNWVAGSLRAGCTPPASGYLLALYEGFNDVSSAHYDYSYYSEKDWFQPKATKEQPEVSDDSYCRPLVFYAFAINCTFSANTLSFTINTSDWEYHTSFKVLIKTHALMDKDADYYNLQVTNTTASTHPSSRGAWIIIHDSYEYNIVGNGSANSDGWTGGVQEADGIAFYYSSFTATDANITFTLKEYGGTTRTYSVSGKTIDAEKTDRCVGVAIDYSKFLPKFSVSDTKKVYFSPGNLQATTTDNGTTWTWAFAAHQWDVIGNAAANTSINGNGTVSANGTVDLFGWVGASGGDAYGISNREGAVDYYGNVNDEELKSDWGNCIGAGWRTPTNNEWHYLLSERISGATVNGTDNARRVYATINTDATPVTGMILFPDGVTILASEATSWSTINGEGSFAESTKCTSAQWSALAAKGCVFLPTTGLRNGANVPDYQLSYGYYWSSSHGSYSDRALNVKFGNNSAAGTNWLSRYYGASVRLVRNVE